MDIFALTDLFCTVLQRGVKWRPVKNRKHFQGGGIAPRMLVTTGCIVVFQLSPSPWSSGTLVSRAQTLSNPGKATAVIWGCAFLEGLYLDLAG